MKEIGERFAEARESMGVTLEEASEDLKIEKQELIEIEAGNIKAFENIVSLKRLIQSYSKYLGLNPEEMLDEYNEYLFDCTSKISLEDIKAAKKKLSNKEKKEEKKVKSPYTNFAYRKKKYRVLVICCAFIILLLAICLTIFYIKENHPQKDTSSESHVIR